MTKIVITSLFTYDPVIVDKKISGTNKMESFKENEGGIFEALQISLRKRVAKDVVDSIMACVFKKEVDILVLLLDNLTDPVQEEALKIIQGKIEDGVKTELVRVDENDMLTVAKATVKAIDSFNSDQDDICVNISSLRNEKTLGMIYGSCARAIKIKEIICVNKETKKIARIFKKSFNLSILQKKVLSHYKDKKYGVGQRDKKTDYDQLKMEKSTFYDILGEMKDKGFMENDNRITELGEIALL